MCAPRSPSSPAPGIMIGFRVQRFRGGLVFKAHRLVYHSTLGLRVIKKKKKVEGSGFSDAFVRTEFAQFTCFRVQGSGSRVQLSI